MLNYFVTAVVNSSFSTCTLTLNIDLVTKREILIILLYETKVNYVDGMITKYCQDTKNLGWEI